MASNHRGDGDRIEVTAGANRVSGVPIVDGGFAGVPMTDCASGDRYSLALTDEWEFDDPTGSSFGAPVYITDASGVLAFAGGAGLRLFGRVSRLPAQGGVPSGKMWVIINGFITLTA
jgi:predicted RecA/RadA family phage recombinase